MLCAIWYPLYSFKNVKNTHGGVLLLVKQQAKSCNFTKSINIRGCFLRFLNCKNGTKSRKASHIIKDYFPRFCKATGNDKDCKSFHQNLSIQSWSGSFIMKTSVIGTIDNFVSKCGICTAQKMKFSIKNFFPKCNQIRRNLRIWSHLLQKFSNFIFCAVLVSGMTFQPCQPQEFFIITSTSLPSSMNS